MESLVYDTASVFVEVKGGAVAGEVTIAPPVLTQKTDVTSPITAEYSSVENRAAVDSSSGEITISAGTDLSDIDGNGFTFNIKVIDSGGAYADFQETVTVNLQKVKSITFGTPPALTYGDGPQMLTAPAVDAANGADTAVTYSTSDAAVADVDSGTGELTIAAAGEVTITATSTFDTSVKGAQTLTIAQKDIATVQDFSISVDDKTVPRLRASDFSVTINNAGLTAETDYGLSIEKKDGAPVDAVTIDNSGLVFIANTIDTGDTGTYTVKAAGETNSNYTGEETVDFVLTVVYSVGDTGPAGGIIFYVNTDPAIGEWTHLEAAPSDLPNYKWGSTSTPVVATGTDIGTGESNTAAIVVALGDNGGTPYAAKICSEYTVTYNEVVYEDWFLPSRNELNELYKQRNTVGGFASSFYWSSSEATAGGAEMQHFGHGLQYSDGSTKNAKNHVRAVRAF